MAKTSEGKADALFWELAAELGSHHPELVEGSIMNSRCLRAGKEFVAMVHREDSGLVVKLPRRRVEELVASGVGQPFAPAGRVFREWVSVPRRDRRRWRALLEEGVAFVTG